MSTRVPGSRSAATSFIKSDQARSPYRDHGAEIKKAAGKHLWDKCKWRVIVVQGGQILSTNHSSQCVWRVITLSRQEAKSRPRAESEAACLSRRVYLRLASWLWSKATRGEVKSKDAGNTKNVICELYCWRGGGKDCEDKVSSREVTQCLTFSDFRWKDKSWWQLVTTTTISEIPMSQHFSASCSSFSLGRTDWLQNKCQLFGVW